MKETLYFQEFWSVRAGSSACKINPSHGGNTGSSPVGSAKDFNQKQLPNAWWLGLPNP
jgi:hypothetical protein